MVLLDHVVQILIMTDLDVSSFVVVIVIDCGSVGSAFVDIVVPECEDPSD